MEEPEALVSRGRIRTGLPSETKEEAILRAGRLLEADGCTEPGYAEAMLDRERIMSTYMGMGLAIPHGTSEAKSKVLRSGISVLQYPEGVDFGEEKACLVIGIAGVGEEHLDILARISSALEDEALLDKLSHTASQEEIYQTLK